MAKSEKIINTPPNDLNELPLEMRTLYDGVNDAIRYTRSNFSLYKKENDMFNILFLGPSGSGKSTLINQLFNKTVAMTGSGVENVTTTTKYIQGTYSWPNLPWYPLNINVIDTFGWGNNMTSNQIAEVITRSLKVNVHHIDKVVFVCSGSLQKDHTECIKEFMDFFQYKKYKEKFAFIYNKCDGLTDLEKQSSLNEVCELLGIGSAAQLVTGVEGTHRINALGFRLGAEFEEIKNEREKLMKLILHAVPKKHIFPRIDNSQRIPVSVRTDMYTISQTLTHFKKAWRTN